MSTYSFKVTKGKYELSLATTDKDFVVEQFSKWVKQASEYSQKKIVRECKEMVTNQINTEKEITQQKIDEQLQKLPQTQNAEERIKQEREKELDTIYNSQSDEKVETNKQEETYTLNNVPFENVLDNSMHSPQAELSFKPNPTIKKDNAFLNYIGGRKVEKNIEYLLLTAYYFTQYEQKPRFTLKQLNAKLMQNLAVIIDHSVLQEAINRDYIECLPDLTGVVGASEYRLTAYGEKTLLEQ